MSADAEDLDLPAVEREITTLAAHLAAATCCYLELVAVFDTGGGWQGYGLRSCSQWLSWKCGLSPGTAREQLRVAHALGDLPAVRGAFAQGQISYSKARALTRAATPQDEEALVATATACTASQLDRLCAGIAKARSNEEVLDQATRASFTARWEPDGTLRFFGRLPAEDGATLLAALAAVRPELVDPAAPADPARETVPVDTHGGTAAGTTGPGRDGGSTPLTVHRPDVVAAAAHSDAAALVLLAEHALPDPPPAVGPSPVRLVVHTTADLLSADVRTDPATGPTTAATAPRDGIPTPAEPASAEAFDTAQPPANETYERVEPASAEAPTVAILDAGPGIPPLPLGPDTLRRLACEALVEAAAHPDTEPTAGVRHRFASARQRRALLTRDEGCAFVGCRRRRGLHAHHLRPAPPARPRRRLAAARLQEPRVRRRRGGSPRRW